MSAAISLNADRVCTGILQLLWRSLQVTTVLHFAGGIGDGGPGPEHGHSSSLPALMRFRWVADIVERIEDTQDNQYRYPPTSFEVIHHIIGVMAVTEHILTRGTASESWF
jgi:hypothetical protein